MKLSVDTNELLHLRSVLDERGLDWLLHDAVAAGEAVSTVFAAVRTMADGAIAGDAVFAAMAKSLADVQAVSDTAAADVGKALADSSTAGDAVSTATAFQRLPDDGATVVDAVTAQASFARTAAETVAPTDLAAMDGSKAAADSQASSDSAALEPGKGVVDSVAAADGASTLATFARSPNDPVPVIDVAAMGVGTGFAEAAMAADAAASTTGKPVDELMTAADALTSFTLLNHELDNAQTFLVTKVADGSARSIGKAPAEFVGVFDGGQATLINYAEDFFAQDYVYASVTILGLTAGVTDPVTAIDATSSYMDHGRAFDEPLPVIDAALADVSAQLLDGAIAADALAIAISRPLADTCASADAGRVISVTYSDHFFGGDYVGTPLTTF